MGACSSPRIGNLKEELAPMGRSYGEISRLAQAA